MLLPQRSFLFLGCLVSCIVISWYPVYGQLIQTPLPENQDARTNKPFSPWGAHWKKLPRKSGQPHYYHDFYYGGGRTTSPKSTKKKLYDQTKGKSSSYKESSYKGKWNGKGKGKGNGKWQGKWQGKWRGKPSRKWNGPSLLGTRYKTVVADFSSLGLREGQSSPVTFYNVEMSGMPVHVDVRLPPRTAVTTTTTQKTTTTITSTNNTSTIKVVATTLAVALNEPCPIGGQEMPPNDDEPFLIRNNDTAVVICQDLMVVGVLYQAFVDRDQAEIRLVRKFGSLAESLEYW